MTGATGPAARSGQTILPQRVRDPGLGEGALRAERRARDRQAPPHHLREVEADLGALQERDLDEAAIIGQRRDIAGEVVAAHHVEDEVRAAQGRHLGGKIRRAVVECGLCAEA